MSRVLFCICLVIFSITAKTSTDRIDVVIAQFNSLKTPKELTLLMMTQEMSEFLKKNKFLETKKSITLSRNNSGSLVMRNSKQSVELSEKNGELYINGKSWRPRLMLSPQQNIAQIEAILTRKSSFFRYIEMISPIQTAEAAVVAIAAAVYVVGAIYYGVDFLAEGPPIKDVDGVASLSLVSLLWPVQAGRDFIEWKNMRKVSQIKCHTTGVELQMSSGEKVAYEYSDSGTSPRKKYLTTITQHHDGKVTKYTHDFKFDAYDDLKGNYDESYTVYDGDNKKVLSKDSKITSWFEQMYWFYELCKNRPHRIAKFNESHGHNLKSAKENQSAR